MSDVLMSPLLRKGGLRHFNVANPYIKILRGKWLNAFQCSKGLTTVMLQCYKPETTVTSDKRR